MYIAFPPVFTFNSKNGVDSFLPFTSLIVCFPLRIYDTIIFGHHLQRSWFCIFIICLFISCGIGAFSHKMIVLLTSIAPYMIMISTYPGVRSRPGFLSPSIISISTFTSSVIILISIPTLTSISKSPFGVLCVVCSHITSSIVIWIITTPIT